MECTVRCSYVSIYLEKVYDLLDEPMSKTVYVKDDKNGVRLDGAAEACCFDETDVMSLIQRGKACLSVLSTRLQVEMNRWHSLFIIMIEQHDTVRGTTKTSYLHLAELASFEMFLKIKGQSVQETKIMHKSFSALGNVIRSLNDGSLFAPYRESKLTSVLKDTFGGNCRSTFIVTASPSSYNVSDTINAIRLGHRIRRITNYPAMNREYGVSQYKTWLMTTEIKFGELSHFVKELASALAESKEKEKGQLFLATPIWDAIFAIVNGEESVENPCRRALALGNLDMLEKHPGKWKQLSRELLKRLPGPELKQVIQERNKAQDLVSDMRSELVVLRRQNELLVQDRRRREKIVAEANREVKYHKMQQADLTAKLEESRSKGTEAVVYLRHMRNLLWNLQKDVTEQRALEIQDITSCLSEEMPDLTGLVDFDTLLLNAGFIESREVHEDLDEEILKYTLGNNNNNGNGNGSSGGGGDDLEEKQGGEESVEGDVRSTYSIENDDTVHGSRRPRPSQKWKFMESLGWGHNKVMVEAGGDSDNDELLFGGASSSRKGSQPSRRELEMKKDIQRLGNKCVDLQLLLNEEKANLETITTRNGSLHTKKLAQELLGLRHEKERLEHVAKATTWKLHEVHVVNNLLSEKTKTLQEQEIALEESLHKLQETFRTTVLDSLDADSQLRDQVNNFERMVDSLIGNYSQPLELDALARPVPRLNAPVRGRITGNDDDGANGGSSVADPTSEESPTNPLILIPSLKMPDQTPARFVHHVSKRFRRGRKIYAYIGDKRAVVDLKHSPSFGRQHHHHLPRLKRSSPLVSF